MQLISLGISELQLFLGMEMELNIPIILVGLLNHLPLTSQTAKWKKKKKNQVYQNTRKKRLLNGLTDFYQTDWILEYFLLHQLLCLIKWKVRHEVGGYNMRKNNAYWNSRWTGFLPHQYFLVFLQPGFEHHARSHTKVSLWEHVTF